MLVLFGGTHPFLSTPESVCPIILHSKIHKEFNVLK
jgi:hypothetical protein